MLLLRTLLASTHFISSYILILNYICRTILFVCKMIKLSDGDRRNLRYVLAWYRRLEADRFFTSYFNEDAYTKTGLEWVNSTESLRDVINRHYPNITSKWMNSTSAFTVWDAPPNSFNPIPLLLRFPPG